MKTRKLFYIVPLTLCLLSCNKWLDYSPFDKLEGDKLYATENGAQTALNGLYLNIQSQSLYSGDMVVMPDVMSQLYYLPSSSHAWYRQGIYEWSNDNAKDKIASMWRLMYKAIADCNVFLREIEENRGRYNQANYLLYRGEALALRTFLHFDLFRLFGPRDSRDMNTMEGNYIPYYDKDSEIPTPYTSGVEFMEHLFADLQEAIGLLEGDPVLLHGLRSGSNATEDFWDYRNFRFNIFAAWVLRARMCLHIGDTDNAYLTATSLLNDINPDTGAPVRFSSTFTPIMDINVGSRDPVFFSEMIFGMHNLRREDVQKAYFSNDLNDNSILLITEAFHTAIGYREGDVRASQWVTSNRLGATTRTFVKFSDTGVSSGTGIESYRYQIMSMIRVGEVYLIAAESSDTDAEARQWLRQLRIYRGMDGNNADSYGDMQEFIRSEHVREFYGEGQYFYFLKRNGYTTIPSNNNLSGQEMTSSRYILPVPDAENDNRVN